MKCNLRVIRKKRGLTQNQLALRSGISQNTISSIECRNYDVSVVTLDKLCRALDCCVGLIYPDFCKYSIDCDICLEKFKNNN